MFKRTVLSIVRKRHAASVIKRYNGGGEFPYTENTLREQYHAKKTQIFNQFQERKVKSDAVFTNSEISLGRISVYGFDYDFTLVHYTPAVETLIYNKAKERLLKHLNYPSHMNSLHYDPSFVIKGLHLDIRTGYLLKMDAYHHIQLGSVYSGHTPVPTDTVIGDYGGTHVPLFIMDDHFHRLGVEGARRPSNLVQFLDSFAAPELTLFADISEHFHNLNIPFDPEYLYVDVHNAIRGVHLSGSIHESIAKDPDQFIEKNSYTLAILQRMKNAGKKTFLITNSPFCNKGMTYAMGSEDWRDLFDVIVCSARKPYFYSDVNRPFRSLNPITLAPEWQKITSLEKNNVYFEGNIQQFINLTKWKGDHVLYIGDHLYSDLTDPTLHLGWKTGAIIPELEDEIKKGNSVEYREGVASLLALEGLLNELQHHKSTELVGVVEQWKIERNKKRKLLKGMYNPYFGSIFRTEKAPTYYSRRLMRFASLYMSSLSNLLSFSLDHTFYSRRASLPHESDLNFDIFYNDILRPPSS